MRYFSFFQCDQGYYNDPEATAKAFQGGWFHSGDLAGKYLTATIGNDDVMLPWRMV